MKRVILFFVLCIPALAFARLPGDYKHFKGGWLGTAHFQAKVHGLVDPPFSASVPLTLTIDAVGKITGEGSPTTGCRISGQLSTFVFPTNYTVELYVTGCNKAVMNRRYSGTFSLNQHKLYAAMDTSSHIFTGPEKGRVYTFTVKLSH